MQTFLFDMLIILGAFFVYVLEYYFNMEFNIFTALIDALFLGFFVYRIFKEKPSRIWPIICVLPLSHITDLVLKSFFSRYFPAPEHTMFLPLLIIFLAAIFYKKPLPDTGRKVILNHTAETQLAKDWGQFPISINNNTAIPELSRYTHVQVIGTTGSGKTRFIFYPQIIQDIRFKNGVFIYDIKSNMRERIEKAVVAYGRDLEYCYFNLGDKNSMTYNPLAGDNAGEISNRIFTALYYNMANSEQYYIDTAQRFLQATTAVLMKKWKIITFEDLYWMTVSPRVYLQPICNEMPNDINARYLLDFIKKPDLDRNLSGLVNKLTQFVTPDWASQINTLNPEIDIGQILNEGKILLFQANSGIYQQEYKPLSILMMMHIQAEIAKRYSIAQDKLKPFFIYLDEFDKIVYPGFSELINKAREAKVGIIFGHQSLGDLKQYGENLKNQILTNSRNKIILKVEDPETAEYFSKTFGTKTIERAVYSYDHQGNVSGHTKKLEEEFNIHPNQLKFLRLGQACVKIEDVTGGKTYIAVIELIDFKDKQVSHGLYRPERKKTDNKTTNVIINEQKADNLTGKSGGLKWRHIKEMAEGAQDKPEIPEENEE